MSNITEYMKSNGWKTDIENLSKKYILNIAQTDYVNECTPNKIGGVLIYNQIVEQIMRETIDLSIKYIRANLWPDEINLTIDFKNKSFESLFNLFKQFAINGTAKDIVVSGLEEYNTLRRKTLYNISSMPTDKELIVDLNLHKDLGENVIYLLCKYGDFLCTKFEKLNDLNDSTIK